MSLVIEQSENANNTIATTEELTNSSSVLFNESELADKLTTLSELIDSQKLEAQDTALAYMSAWPMPAQQALFNKLINALDMFDFYKANEILKEIESSLV